jgi:hypothetical protein
VRSSGEEQDASRFDLTRVRRNQPRNKCRRWEPNLGRNDQWEPNLGRNVRFALGRIKR